MTKIAKITLLFVVFVDLIGQGLITTAPQS